MCLGRHESQTKKLHFFLNFLSAPEPPSNPHLITGNGTNVDVLNTVQDTGEPYWMNSLPIDIVIDRRTMRLLGIDCVKLGAESFRHPAVATNVLAEEDDVYWDQFLDPIPMTYPTPQRSPTVGAVTSWMPRSTGYPI